MDIEELLYLAKRQELSKEEVAAVAKQLQDNPARLHEYKLLYIVGEAGDASYQTLVESFLKHPDEMMRQLALSKLCFHWKLTAHYLALINDYIDRELDDPDENIRATAIAIAGDYLGDHKDTALLRKVMQILEDPSEEEEIREFAYHALCDALGVRPTMDNPRKSGFKNIDFSILPKANDRLNKEQAYQLDP